MNKITAMTSHDMKTTLQNNWVVFVQDVLYLSKCLRESDVLVPTVQRLAM